MTVEQFVAERQRQAAEVHEHDELDGPGDVPMTEYDAEVGREEDDEYHDRGPFDCLPGPPSGHHRSFVTSAACDAPCQDIIGTIVPE
jgi:hypothetical protein